MSQQRITRDDLEAKFKSLQDDVQGKVYDKKQTLLAAGSVVAVVVVLIVFFLGKRSGKKKTTFVEIRRI
jgi:ABC-type glycerol-3-phosphate transport system permease component